MPAVEMLDMHKQFGTTTALAGASLTLRPGSIHGLLGENGAGKTTLMNVLIGLVAPDAGKISIDSQTVLIGSPRDAIRMGIGMVHQHFMLADAFSVLDNVLLADRRQSAWLDRTSARKRLIQLAGELQLEVDPGATAGALSVGMRQRVEILKALWRDARVLILDEPTAVLTPQETEQLLDAMRRLRDSGRVIVFISHKLREIRDVCDELTILRRGQVAWSGPASGESGDALAARMVGLPVASFNPVAWQVKTPDSVEDLQTQAAPHALELRGACAYGLDPISLHIGAEILGIAGVDGNGQQALAELVSGLLRPLGGNIFLLGRDITRLSAARRFAMGLSHIPNDRRREGLVASMSIAENLALKSFARRPASRFGFLRPHAIQRLAGEMITRHDIRASSPEQPAGTLSGGNAQKVILARELSLRQPALVVAMNPTRGLDLSATRFVHEQLRAHRTCGCGILLISSELDELLALSDRIAVLYRGRLTMSGFPNEDAARIGRLMAGIL